MFSYLCIFVLFFQLFFLLFPQIDMCSIHILIWAVGLNRLGFNSAFFCFELNRFGFNIALICLLLLSILDRFNLVLLNLPSFGNVSRILAYLFTRSNLLVGLSRFWYLIAYSLSVVLGLRIQELLDFASLPCSQNQIVLFYFHKKTLVVNKLHFPIPMVLVYQSHYRSFFSVQTSKYTCKSCNSHSVTYIVVPTYFLNFLLKL